MVNYVNLLILIFKFCKQDKKVLNSDSQERLTIV